MKLGEYIVFKLKDIKHSVFPNAYIRQINDFMKRREEFYRTFISKGDLCFDVGANRGDVVQPLLRIGAKVVAVEPQTKCYNYLGWKFGSKINLVKKGLGEAEGVKEMHISDSDTISSFSEQWISKVKEGRFQTHNWNKTESIQMTTLDALIKQFGTPKFIKIDVEGYEYEVLKGLNSKVPFIAFEYTVPEQVENTVKCIEKINSINQQSLWNYTTGISMEPVLQQWISSSEMTTLVRSEKFIATSMGDIYVKSVG
ncbi:MAG: FkbM family methyltransferase [Chitinophagaceae bacterium]|nr:FkbM family methyltransferase [Chitinophagaceae bacterium]